jgi:large subunit ribosomal protein L25
MIETIQVKKRDVVGSWNVRKLRATGQIPANLYGHGEANLNLSVATETVNKLLKHGTKLVSLTGDVTDTALLREVQWDSLGSYVVHLDFTRVSQTELVEISLPVHLHGEAPGAVGSGQLRFVTHEVTIRCPAASLPEFLTVEIGQLQLGQAIHVNEMKLPEGASAVTPGSVVIVQVVAAAGEADDAAAAAVVEPELIRKEKPDADAKA